MCCRDLFFFCLDSGWLSRYNMPARAGPQVHCCPIPFKGIKLYLVSNAAHTNTAAHSPTQPLVKCVLGSF
jgi:hypothetical protein